MLKQEKISVQISVEKFFTHWTFVFADDVRNKSCVDHTWDTGHMRNHMFWNRSFPSQEHVQQPHSARGDTSQELNWGDLIRFIKKFIKKWNHVIYVQAYMTISSVEFKGHFFKEYHDH